MHELGVIVINRVHGASRPRDSGTAPRVAPLVTRSHTIDGFDCQHTLVTVDGSICETTIDAAGHQHITDPLERIQVRRAYSAANGYRFTVGVRIDCTRRPFETWIAVHDHADYLRALPPHDPHFAALYGLRNDSESNNEAYKSTLTHRRAAGLGWHRQLLDVVGWAILTNARALAIHGPNPQPPRTEPAAVPPDPVIGGAAAPGSRHGPWRQRLAGLARSVADTLSPDDGNAPTPTTRGRWP
jgi:hypothetical protein